MSAAATAANARLTFEELSQLNERKLELKRQHNGYMEKHPEITRILADFMCAALLEKPDDVFSFAEAHFSAFEGKQEGHRPIVVACSASARSPTSRPTLPTHHPSVN